MSDAAPTKIVTLEELRANKSRDSFYILIHGKGTCHVHTARQRPEFSLILEYSLQRQQVP